MFTLVFNIVVILWGPRAGMAGRKRVLDEVRALLVASYRTKSVSLG